MNSFRRTFTKPHTFLVVVHAVSADQALANARIAQNGGADGIFLINHNIPALKLLEAFRFVTDKLPGFWVGLNCLDYGWNAVEIIPRTTAGLWIDNAGIEEAGDDCVAVATQFAELRVSVGWEGIYFGGVAFKYQKPVSDFAAVAKAAIPWVDVITTSGMGTGKAPDVGKIATMKDAIGNHPLAIASGITPENVHLFAPHADCFLVATGVSKSHTELDPARVRLLADKLS